MEDYIVDMARRNNTYDNKFPEFERFARRDMRFNLTILLREIDTRIDYYNKLVEYKIYTRDFADTVISELNQIRQYAIDFRS